MTNPFLLALFSGPAERQQHIRQFYALCGRSLEYEHSDAHRPMETVHVYPEGKNGYSAEAVYEGFFQTREWAHATVEIGSGSLRGGLRVDIAERPGVIDVSGISVRKAVNDELVYRATGAAELAALEVRGTLTALENAEVTEFRRYINSGKDPQLSLKLDPKLTDQPLRLDLWVRFHNDVSILLPWLKGYSKQKNDALRSQLEAEKNDLKQKLSAMNIERQSWTSHHARLKGESYVLKKDLALADLNRKQLEARISALEQDKAKLEATMHGVLNSRSWKLTRPIRRLMEGRRDG